jgi:hypothetical protein
MNKFIGDIPFRPGISTDLPGTGISPHFASWGGKKIAFKGRLLIFRLDIIFFILLI